MRMGGTFLVRWYQFTHFIGDSWELGQSFFVRWYQLSHFIGDWWELGMPFFVRWYKFTHFIADSWFMRIGVGWKGYFLLDDINLHIL